MSPLSLSLLLLPFEFIACSYYRTVTSFCPIFSLSNLWVRRLVPRYPHFRQVLGRRYQVQAREVLPPARDFRTALASGSKISRPEFATRRLVQSTVSFRQRLGPGEELQKFFTSSP